MAQSLLRQNFSTRFIAAGAVMTAIALWPVHAQAFVRCGDPPADWQANLALDQNHNIIRRTLLTEKEKATQYVYQFELPADQVKHQRSKDRKRASPETVTLYVAQSWTGAELAQLTQYLGPVVKVYCGQRVTSHASLFVWDPDRKELPFFIKNSGGATPPLSDLFADALKRSGVKGIKYMPETEHTLFVPYVKALLEKLPDLFVSVRREARPFPGRWTPKKNLLAPLHGFLGSEMVDEVARRAGKSRDQWIREVYLPTLADFFTKLHYEVGFHHGSHTQNLLLEIDRATGRIKAVVIRDLNDLAPDYFKLLAEKKIEIPRHDPIRYINGDWGIDLKQLNQREMSLPGVNFGVYSFQSVSRYEPDPKKQMEYSLVFLKDYIAKAEAQLKRPIPLNEEAREALAWLEKGDYNAPRVHSELKGRLHGTSLAFRDVIQNVSDYVATERAPSLQIEIKPLEQPLLRNAFIGSEKTYSTSRAFLSVDPATSIPPKEWTYAFDGEKIFALDRNRRVVAATLSIPEQRKDSLRRLSLKPSLEATCSRRFQELVN